MLHYPNKILYWRLQEAENFWSKTSTMFKSFRRIRYLDPLEFSLLFNLQDNLESKHTSRVIRTIFRDLQQMVWPPQSPNLNIMKSVWKRHWHKLNPQELWNCEDAGTTTHLKRAIAVILLLILSSCFSLIVRWMIHEPFEALVPTFVSVVGMLYHGRNKWPGDDNRFLNEEH